MDNEELEYRPGETWATYLARMIPVGSKCHNGERTCEYYQKADKMCALFDESCRWGKCQSCKINGEVEK
jgi:hypothetical protein